MKYIVDRITEGKAVLESETGERKVVDASLLPDGVREGGCLAESNGCFLPDRAMEAQRRRGFFFRLRRFLGTAFSRTEEK